MLDIAPRTPIPQLTINITADIIAKSDPSESRTCAVAQALRIQHGAESVEVTAERMKFNMLGKDRDGTTKMMRYNIATPSIAAVNLSEFDRTGYMKPFKFRTQRTDAFAEPVVKRGPRLKPRRPNKLTAAPKAKRCKRRFHGLKIIEVQAA